MILFRFKHLTLIKLFLLQTDYLGPVDLRSYHGGCDIIRGRKWIANNWISATTYEDRLKQVVAEHFDKDN